MDHLTSGTRLTCDDMISFPVTVAYTGNENVQCVYTTSV